MGRSVSVPSDAFAVSYQQFDGEEDFDWEFFIDDIKEQVKSEFPSFEDADFWLDREDHALLENRFAYFGVSEYCGLVSLWLVLKDELDDRDYALAQGWANRVKSSFEKKFGTLRKVGSFSNGEGVYERK